MVWRWVLLATILASRMAFIDTSALRADLHTNGAHLPMILAGASLGDPQKRARAIWLHNFA